AARRRGAGAAASLLCDVGGRPRRDPRHLLRAPSLSVAERPERALAVDRRAPRATRSEAARAPPAPLALAPTVADEWFQLLDGLLHLGLPRARLGQELVGALELAERLLELAAELGGDRQVVEALALVAALPERDARETMRLVEVAVEDERALELRQRLVLVAGRDERLSELEVRPAVGGRAGQMPRQGLARLRRLLERPVHRAQRTIAAIAEPAQVSRPLHGGPRRLELPDGLVHAAQEKLALGVVRLLVGELLVPRDDRLRR